MESHIAKQLAKARCQQIGGIAADGHPFGVPTFGLYFSAFALPANQPFRLTSARRIDLLVRPTRRGSFPFRVGYYDWIYGPDSPFPHLYHIAKTVIDVV